MNSHTGGLHWLERAWLTRGLLARLLLPLAWAFGALTATRKLLYRFGWLRAQSLGVPVVVVGNLIVGGAGKTPTVMALVGLLRRHGYTPGIISRGYGGSGDGDGGTLEVHPQTAAAACGDEPLMMRWRTGAPVFVGRNRVAAGRALRRAHPAVDVVVSDDGLQHLRLARDAQVLVFDERGVGNGWLLPAGPLREALPASVPTRGVVLYNARTASTPLAGNLAARSLAGAVELAAWRAGQAASIGTLESLRGTPLTAVAGVARPNRFFEMLREQGLQISALPLPDHFDFATLPWPAGTPDVVLTEKDAVKLEPVRLGGTRVWVVALDFALPAAFEKSLLALLPDPPTPAPGIAHGNQTA
ncbi:MAG: tetraacyldisaccharide 4'-kinase [Burkholderiales bacterium]